MSPWAAQTGWHEVGVGERWIWEGLGTEEGNMGGATERRGVYGRGKGEERGIWEGLGRGEVYMGGARERKCEFDHSTLYSWTRWHGGT